MRSLILSGFVGFAGFILGIFYTVQAAEESFLVTFVAIVKGLMNL